jgi:hypothetical protein
MGRNVTKVTEKFFDCGPIKDSDGNIVEAKQVGQKEFWGKYESIDQYRHTARGRARKGPR